MSEFPPLEALLPHRSPMILLDAVADSGEASITCTVRLRPDSPFVEQGSAPALVATEYMAQCVAAYAGLKATRQGAGVQTGYLIGARKIDFSVDRFEVGEELTVEAKHVWGDDALGSFECRVESNGLRKASAVLTVYQGKIDGR